MEVEEVNTWVIRFLVNATLLANAPKHLNHTTMM